MAALLLLLLVGLFAAAVITGIILLVVRLADSSKSEPYVPHGWQPTTEPGWYPDTRDPNVLRYFDGQQWTSATRQMH
ncbi:hypothetical protein BST27_17295 [Mycobacterium intermedium]|uniref:DUF2510 domain-containing protein n=2 Tax=Mycobacterium TaxID=1763 RepID=A0A1E3SDV7_MYCIE|nr:DUF2510 domain-containing protein [Mycobacterium intermedium]GFG89933.1 hypothetical protein MBOU_19750 [Mycobacterium bourgelatii]MCV6965967.1 DUF2510 domain-containing protein [Mycobacterium intermedium]ODR00356.1 hypothetical protein BHQ20_13465 [Mycobacterium intermedium]OPE51061.1 hypothetical protein BV508_07830 [Mycobacterium intermedium]ORB01765.1 hypothetical protein BST27_17295 [Mycobacterium intermedium]